MKSEISKTYDPASMEAGIYRIWLEEKCFAADPSAPGEPYSIVIPPPNVTGALHLGHAINNTLQDILTRVHRMRGFNAVWIPGIDHAGIATQAIVEKQLKEKENKTRHDVGREGLVERIWQWKQQYGDRIIEQLKRMGCSCDWDRTRFTLDEMCAKAVRETFFKLFKDGLIYRGKRLVNWDVHLQTSISDDEIYHENVKTSLWHIRYPIVDSQSQLNTEHTEDTETQRNAKNDPLCVSVSSVNSVLNRPSHMTVATTRPETMLGDTAVAVHSEDPRWNWAIGKSVELPLTGRKIPIIADDILVDPKFGSGVVKVTPAHDPNDYAVWQRHQGKPDQIDIINILNPDGTINQAGRKYAGMKRDAARKKMVADLTELGLLEKEEPYETQVGHSDRSKTPVEPYLSDQWFVKMAPLAEPALQVVRDGVIKFFPERHAQQYLSWLGEKRDWPISRQLWWGHRIPVWHQHMGLELAYEKTFGAKADGINIAEFWDNLRLLNKVGRIAFRSTRQMDAELNSEDIFICLLDANDKEIESFLTNWGFTQDPDVLDTWFSSALWPHSTLGWPADTADLRKWYPTSVLLTGRDIITLWVARMVMMGMYNMGGDRASRGTGILPVHSSAATEPQEHRSAQTHGQDAHATGEQKAKHLGIPFHHVVINPTILDGKGERMSKSKGNGVDPVDVIDTHGADALRFTLGLMATETQDVRMPVKKDSLGRNTSDKFDIGSRFCNKIWQVANFFVISNLKSIPAAEFDANQLSLADKWIISRFHRTMAEADAALTIYRFDQYTKICYDFFYGDFCDWYVEAAKPALKNASRHTPSPGTPGEGGGKGDVGWARPTTTPDAVGHAHPTTSSAGQTTNVLAAILDGSLRLLHPVIPFITEALWTHLNEARSDRTLNNLLQLPPSKRLIHAAWPKAGKPDENAEYFFGKAQEMVTGIRSTRNDYKVDLKKTIEVYISASSEEIKQIELIQRIVEHLANCQLKITDSQSPIPGNVVRAVGIGFDAWMQDLIDPEAERLRVAKRRDELTKQIQTMETRLSSESYVSRAPAQKVQETRDQLAQAKTELAKLG